jgi:hypothetical protein
MEVRRAPTGPGFRPGPRRQKAIELSPPSHREATIRQGDTGRPGMIQGHQRVEVGGTLDVTSPADGGTALLIEIPVWPGPEASR